MTRLVGFNALLGLFAICPLTAALSLLAYASDGPYAPGTNHTYATVGGQPPPLEIDTDEAGIVAMGLLVAAMVLVPVFFAINIPLVRRLRPQVPAALSWFAALVVVVLPFCVVLGLWW
ncbi:hypothetical protein [Symbioplanes lichenis]|uniref:hypothetical protein n=1 Tax=Symbioplanes lichenis TaxID=1629072 RepID=UPI002739AAFB|nr:hypothetical protein [Actinoplanes lichenis]